MVGQAQAALQTLGGYSHLPQTELLWIAAKADVVAVPCEQRADVLHLHEAFSSELLAHHGGEEYISNLASALAAGPPAESSSFAAAADRIQALTGIRLDDPDSNAPPPAAAAAPAPAAPAAPAAAAVSAVEKAEDTWEWMWADSGTALTRGLAAKNPLRWTGGTRDEVAAQLWSLARAAGRDASRPVDLQPKGKGSLVKHFASPAAAADFLLPPPPPPSAPPASDVPMGLPVAVPVGEAKVVTGNEMVGRRVGAVKLTGRPEFNGCVGTVRSWDQSRGRYLVQLDAHSGQDVTLKRENLELL
jgi:hypothetical protein